MKSALKIIAWAILTAGFLMTFYIIGDAVKKDITDYQHVKVFVISSRKETRGQAQTYNNDYSRGIKIKYGLNTAIVIFDTGQQLVFDRKAIYVYSYFAKRRKEGYEIVGIKGDKVEGLNALFDV